jgi:UPF0755 protein
MRKLKIIIGILIITAISGLFILYQIFFAPNVSLSKEQVQIDIPEHIDLDSLSRILKPYLKNNQTFYWTARVKKFKTPKPGRYQIQNKMSNNELINMLRIGKRVEVNVTFNNQNSLQELAGAIAKQIAPDSITLLRVMQDSNFIKQNGFTPDNILLMYIPNTYRMYYNTSANQFRKKMLREYRKFWNKKRTDLAKKQHLTPIKAGILASIIQKESTQEEELPKIAGVYLNRLQKNMLLQADPTVVFAYQQQHGKDLIIKRVLNKHKAVDSPYNTYKHAGLPPGPICMPDIRSIQAVLQPEKHHYYYFVADVNKPGYHIFSKTLNEHNRHANTYRNNLNKQKIFH